MDLQNQVKVEKKRDESISCRWDVDAVAKPKKWETTRSQLIQLIEIAKRSKLIKEGRNKLLEVESEWAKEKTRIRD